MTARYSESKGRGSPPTGPLACGWSPPWQPPRMVPLRLSSSALALAFFGLVMISACPAHAQVTLGYNNPITSSASRSRIGFQGARSTRLFQVTGLNTEPIDGSLIYDETTVWRIHDPDAPTTSLSVLSLDPLVKFQQDTTRRDDVRVQREEAVSATVSGPLATTSPDDPRDWLQPQEFSVPSQLLSVFADTGGP